MAHDRRNMFTPLIPLAVGAMFTAFTSIGGYYVIDYLKTRDDVVELKSVPPSREQWLAYQEMQLNLQSRVMLIESNQANASIVVDELKTLISDAQDTLREVNIAVVKMNASQGTQLNNLERRIDNLEH